MAGNSVIFGNRRIPPRQPLNPVDKCTVFSIYPKEIDEVKHTIQPGRFIIPAGKPEAPTRLVVGSSSWWREIDVDQPYLEIPNSSLQVANSIVNDYCNGLIGCNMDDAMPGIFFIPGIITVEQLLTEYKSTYDRAVVKQTNFWNSIINLTDILWANTGGNPLCVSGDARLACKELGIENKDWMQNFQNSGMVRCVACGTLRNPAFPVCGTCNRVVDKELAAKLGLIDSDNPVPPPPVVEPASQGKSIDLDKLLSK
jgi:hypothetical protein